MTTTRLVYQPGIALEREPPWARRLAEHPAGYLAGEGLAQAVNVALTLEKPLLLTGEPGTGKTQIHFLETEFFHVSEEFDFLLNGWIARTRALQSITKCFVIKPHAVRMV